MFPSYVDTIKVRLECSLNPVDNSSRMRINQSCFLARFHPSLEMNDFDPAEPIAKANVTRKLGILREKQFTDLELPHWDVECAILNRGFSVYTPVVVLGFHSILKRTPAVDIHRRAVLPLQQGRSF